MVASASTTTTTFPPFSFSSKSQISLSRSALPVPLIPKKSSHRCSLHITNCLSRFAPDQPRKGSDVLVEALERHGVTTVFAYPGSATMEIHQSLTRSTLIRNILPCNQQGGGFAAEGYSRASGLPDVCIATLGPDTINIMTGIARAMHDSVPLIAITGDVPSGMRGENAFLEAAIIELTRPITKYNYLVLDVEAIPSVVKEAFYLAVSGQPGPVLIDVPYKILQQLVVSQ